MNNAIFEKTMEKLELLIGNLKEIKSWISFQKIT